MTFSTEDLKVRSLRELASIYNSITGKNVTFKISKEEAIAKILAAQEDTQYEEEEHLDKEKLEETSDSTVFEGAEIDEGDVTSIEGTPNMPRNEQTIEEEWSTNDGHLEKQQDEPSKTIDFDDIEEELTAPSSDLDQEIDEDDLEDCRKLVELPEDDGELAPEELDEEELLALEESIEDAIPIDEDDDDLDDIRKPFIRERVRHRKSAVREIDVARRIASALAELSGEMAYTTTDQVAERAGTKRGTTANYLSNWLHGRMRCPIEMSIQQSKLTGRFVGWRLDN